MREMKTFTVIFIVVILAIPSILASVKRMCNSGSECNDNECCISNNPPRGRRFLDTQSHLGHCAPMGTDGSVCLMRYAHLTSKPDDVIYDCPCGTGLNCHGDGIVEIPLGEIGHCTSQQP